MVEGGVRLPAQALLISHFFTFPKPNTKSNNEFEDVVKDDVKTSWGFFLFMALWLGVSVIWLALGGAQDGAWWMFATAVVVLLVNSVAKWFTRNEGKQ